MNDYFTGAWQVETPQIKFTPNNQQSKLDEIQKQLEEIRTIVEKLRK